MSFRLLSRSLLTLGCLLVLLGLGMAQAKPSLAQDLPPRPTIAPTEAPATTTPTSAPVEEDDDDDGGDTMPGRITGTIIDQRTGAPAANIIVNIGIHVVSSDSNGNYDLNGLAPGAYLVELALAEGQGQPAQGPIELQLGSGETIVQHLSFLSPEITVAQPTFVPTATPVPPTPAAVPAVLPNTGEPTQPVELWFVLLGLLLMSLGLGLRIKKS